MLDKYFGFLRIQDEFTVIESLLEHTRIDEEEITLLEEMLESACEGNYAEVRDIYNRLEIISSDSARIFETIADQIIQANFDIRKQYDLLRLYQRIDKISREILSCAHFFVILSDIQGTIPQELHNGLKGIILKLHGMHNSYAQSLRLYLDSKKDVMMSIHKVEQEEYELDKECIIFSAGLYQLGNANGIPQGTYSLLTELIRSFRKLASAIETTTTSLDWLLLSS